MKLRDGEVKGGVTKVFVLGDIFCHVGFQSHKQFASTSREV